MGRSTMVHVLDDEFSADRWTKYPKIPLYAPQLKDDAVTSLQVVCACVAPIVGASPGFLVNCSPQNFASVPARFLGLSLLPKMDVQRYRFQRVLKPAPGCQGQIELYVDEWMGEKIAVKRVPIKTMLLNPNASIDLKSQGHVKDDSWKDFCLAQHIGRDGPGRIQGVCFCHGAFSDAHTGDALLVSEYCPNGDLLHLANTLGVAGRTREWQVWPVIRSLLQIVDQMHERDIAHGDLSLENVLLGAGSLCEGSLELKVIDFGMSVAGDVDCVTGVRGKPSYLAPEMFEAHPYDARASDLFACGVIAYALAVGNYPWTSTVPGACAKWKFAREYGMHAFLNERSIVRNDVEVGKVASLLSPVMQSLLLALLHPDPAERFVAFSIMSI